MSYVCDECGLDLTLTPEQERHLVRYGNPIPRPPCPNTASGRHRVSAEQIERVRKETGVGLLQGMDEVAP